MIGGIEHLLAHKAILHPGELARQFDRVCVRCRPETVELPEHGHPQRFGQSPVIEKSLLMLPLSHDQQKNQDGEVREDEAGEQGDVDGEHPRVGDQMLQDRHQMGEHLEAEERGKAEGEHPQPVTPEVRLPLLRQRIGNRVKPAPAPCNPVRLAPGREVAEAIGFREQFAEASIDARSAVRRGKKLCGFPIEFVRQASERCKFRPQRQVPFEIGFFPCMLRLLFFLRARPLPLCIQTLERSRYRVGAPRAHRHRHRGRLVGRAGARRKDVNDGPDPGSVQACAHLAARGERNSVELEPD